MAFSVNNNKTCKLVQGMCARLRFVVIEAMFLLLKCVWNICCANVGFDIIKENEKISTQQTETSLVFYRTDLVSAFIQVQKQGYCMCFIY